MHKPIYSDPDEQDIKSWDLPFVEDDMPPPAEQTNALNRRSDWKYEPPESADEDIAPPTAEEIEAIRQQAYEEGFAEGKAEGLEKGLAEGQEKGYEEGFAKGQQAGHEAGFEQGKTEGDALVERWQSLMETLHDPVAKVERSVESELVRLAVSLARAVIRSEVKTNQDLIFQALSEGLKVLPIQEQQYQIHLHPDDLALVRQHFSEEDIENHHWVLIESPNMTPGGCDISTSNNAVDVSVERRCRDVLDKFLLEQGLGRGDDD
ncbi:flagellar assembly protein FliH [Aestuariibacter halophilus]|uniref:Flagellar assembly protein FliH n=1 Tax=Fluctibacter halophilus TaxID=226011 RepID=A0ABS8G3H5_9ALTE|nr:flagellar assembly protein FliH [Aestuariibacter halophilus]MCC2615147.1 flagellar assembly protein FliH [Aestuariibacter halophilus]